MAVVHNLINFQPGCASRFGTRFGTQSAGGQENDVILCVCIPLRLFGSGLQALNPARGAAQQIVKKTVGCESTGAAMFESMWESVRYLLAAKKIFQEAQEPLAEHLTSLALCEAERLLQREHDRMRDQERENDLAALKAIAVQAGAFGSVSGAARRGRLR